MSVDELAKERYDLAVERIREIREEKTVAEPYLDFFTKTAGFLEEMICLRNRVETGEMKKLSLEELRLENTGYYQDILPENYEDAEARTIRELQSIRKPFVVLVNSKKPHGQEAKEKAKKLEDTYGVKAMTVNCEQIKEEDIYRILEAVLYEFPISEVQFYIPKWVEMLPVTHKIKQDLLEHIQKILEHLEEIRDAAALTGRPESPYIKDWYVEQIQMDTGCVIMKNIIMKC